ncbi:DUF1857-domain-containing protein, partial [Crepidotus variabilis]
MPTNFAASRPVNPPGAEPKLTIEQLWTGLDTKIKQPELFVPGVIGAELVSEDGKLIRKMTTKNGEVIQEYITTYNGTMVYFDGVETDARVTNAISYDQNGELLLTFTFVGGIPGQQGLGANTSAEEQNEFVGDVVQQTIDGARGLVRQGI